MSSFAWPSFSFSIHKSGPRKERRKRAFSILLPGSLQPCGCVVCTDYSSLSSLQLEINFDKPLSRLSDIRKKKNQATRPQLVNHRQNGHLDSSHAELESQIISRRVIMFFHILLSALTALLVFFHISVRYSKQGRMLSKIPGPFTLPIIGNLYLFTDRSQRGFWVTFRKISDTWYPICKGWILGIPVVSIRHPDDLEIILLSQKSSYKDYPYSYLRIWMHDGLFTNKGDATHRIRRKMLTPAFHFNMLQGYINIINQQSDRFISELRSNGKEFVLDIMSIYTDFTFNIIIESAMGVDLDKADKKSIKAYKKACEDMGAIVTYKMLNPYIQEWMMTRFTEMGRKQIHALKVLQEFTNKVVKERREYHEKHGGIQSFKEFTKDLENQHESESIYTIEYKKKLPMLDILLSAEKDGLMDEKGIKEEVNTFLFGGTDTTSTALAFFTMALAENKACQDRARAEVCEVFERSGGKIGMSELSQMPYLEQCIKESLRLYPVASTILRYTIDEVQLKKYTIPPGVVVVCNIFEAQRDPNFWKDPEKFDPDRFLPENFRRQHPFSFIPFSAGSRNCVGQKFAWLEMKFICSHLLYNFYLEPVDSTRDIKIIADLVLRLEDPFHVKFIRINTPLEN